MIILLLFFGFLLVGILISCFIFEFKVVILQFAILKLLFTYRDNDNTFNNQVMIIKIIG